MGGLEWEGFKPMNRKISLIALSSLLLSSCLTSARNSRLTEAESAGYELTLELENVRCIPVFASQYPNPFSFGPTLPFRLPDSGFATVSFYDSLGVRVVTAPDSVFAVPGAYHISLRGKGELDNSSAGGRYTCIVKLGDSSYTRELDCQLAEVQFGMPFYLAESTLVSLRVYNADGEVVATLIDSQWYQKGQHSALWDRRSDSGVDAPTGMYFYRLEMPDTVLTRKTIVLR